MSEISPEDLPTRWEIELEFVQSLANIQYVTFLAQNSYFTNPEFLNYLRYLQYWKRPEYSKYLVYPNCLHILSLLQTEEFRRNIVNPEFMNTVMNDMVKRWQGLEVQVQGLLDEGQNEGQKESGQDGLELVPQGLALDPGLAPALGQPEPVAQPEPGHAPDKPETKVNGDINITLPSVPSVPGTALNQTMDETMMTAASPDLLAEPPLGAAGDMNID